LSIFLLADSSGKDKRYFSKTTLISYQHEKKPLTARSLPTVLLFTIFWSPAFYLCILGAPRFPSHPMTAVGIVTLKITVSLLWSLDPEQQHSRSANRLPPTSRPNGREGKNSSCLTSIHRKKIVPGPASFYAQV